MDSILKPTLVLMTGRALAFGATFLIPLVLARVFDQAQFGTYKLLLLVFSTLVAVAPLGMAESLYYFVPGDPSRAGGYVANATLFLVLAGAGCVALLAAAGPWLAAALGAGAGGAYLVPIGAFTALMLVAAPLETIMIAGGRYRSAAATYAVSDIARAALFALPAALTGSLAWLVAGAVLFAALRLAGGLVYLVRRFGRELRPDLGALRAQLRYALPFGAAAIVEIAQGTYHQYAVSWQCGAAAFALYSVGCLQVPLVDFIAGPAGNVAMVHMAALRGDREAIVRLWHGTTRQLALVFVPLVALVELTAGDLIVALYTPLYAQSAPIFRLWCVTILLSTLQTDAVLRVHARTRFILGLNLLRLALIASTITWALRTFGLPGAALAAVVALAVAKTLALLRLRPLLGTGLARLLPWGTLFRIAGVSMAAAAPALLVHAEMEAAPLVRLVCVASLYAVTYAALALPLLFTAAERSALAGWLARPGRRIPAEPGVVES